MSALQIMGWGAWALLLLFAISWTIMCYIYIKRGATLTYATLNTTIVWWFLLGWTFYYSSINKLHLFWLAPSVVPLALHATISRSLANIGGKKMLPPGLFLLLGGYGFVLWWLTD